MGIRDGVGRAEMGMWLLFHHARDQMLLLLNPVVICVS